MLDDRSERVLAEVSRELQSILDTRLVSLALYGSGAGGDHVPGVSDLNLVAAVDDLDHGVLAAVRPRVERWRKRGVATPLLLDRSFLARAADVFPIELGDIHTTHRILFGTDVFAELRIDTLQLRQQCEREARGKLLRLRELYLEIGGRRRELRTLMIDSVKTFLIVMRSVGRLAGLPESATCEELVERFSGAFACELPVLLRLLQTRLGRRKWEGDEEDLFRSYLDELGLLVDVIDRAVPGEPR